MTGEGGEAARIVLMGVSGSGKTTLGLALAERLGFRFYDADDFHPPANVAKMAAGLPLNDADRDPWLGRLADLLATAPPEQPVALACSALRLAYRDRLRTGCEALIFVHLAGSRELIGQRLAARQGHYMPPSLLASQFEALEPAAAHEAILVLDAAQPPDAMVDQISDGYSRSGSRSTRPDRPRLGH